jgi:hypothetical protein
MKQVDINKALLSDVISSSVYTLPVAINITETKIVSDTTSNTLITGTGTLEQSVTIKFDDAFTPKDGWSGVINWRSTLTVGAFTVTIQSTNVTALVTGAQSIDFNIIYLNGAWEVTNIVSEVDALLPDLTPYATKASPTFTGTVTVPAISGYADNTTKAAPTSFVQNCITYVQTILAPLASPTFTGTVTIPTVAGTSDSSTKAASTAFVQAVRALLAPLASPALTGTPTSTTPETGNNSTKIATTAFVTATVAPLQKYVAAGVWAAGTIDLTTLITGVHNTVVPTSVTGNIVLTASAFGGGNVSEVTIHLPISGGAYTVTAGANMSFTTITGVNTHTPVLTLSWNAVQSLYIQKSVSQN